MGLNYGFNKVRFVSPVKTGSRLRGRFFLRDIQNQGGGKSVSAMDLTIDIEGEDRPAVVGERLAGQFVRSPRIAAADPTPAEKDHDPVRRQSGHCDRGRRRPRSFACAAVRRARRQGWNGRLFGASRKGGGRDQGCRR